MGRGLTVLDMTLSVAQILLFLEISLLSSLDCYTIPDLLTCPLKPSSSKLSGQLIILLKILRVSLLPLRREKFNLFVKNFKTLPGFPRLLQPYLLQLLRSLFGSCIVAMGNHMLFPTWASALSSPCQHIMLKTASSMKPSLIIPHFLICAYNFLSLHLSLLQSLISMSSSSVRIGAFKGKGHYPCS